MQLCAFMAFCHWYSSCYCQEVLQLALPITWVGMHGSDGNGRNKLRPSCRNTIYSVPRRYICGNVANVEMLPMLPVPMSNWLLVIGIGNIFTLATFNTACSMRKCVLRLRHFCEICGILPLAFFETKNLSIIPLVREGGFRYNMLCRGKVCIHGTSEYSLWISSSNTRLRRVRLSMP